MNLKKFLRVVIPLKIRLFLWRIVPKMHIVNTYILTKPKLIRNPQRIDSKYSINEISQTDKEQLTEVYKYRGSNSYRKQILPRLLSKDWVGLAVFDNTNGEIAYIAWIIIRSIRYFEEFGVHLQRGQFLLKDGFCVPEYRHQGLHTRMEQERINYCVRNNADSIFIQILDANKKGIDSVIKNGYVLYSQRRVIQWSLFGVYREMWSFLRSPFRKIVK
jgi:hypothetical protein